MGSPCRKSSLQRIARRVEAPMPVKISHCAMTNLIIQSLWRDRNEGRSRNIGASIPFLTSMKTLVKSHLITDPSSTTRSTTPSVPQFPRPSELTNSVLLPPRTHSSFFLQMFFLAGLLFNLYFVVCHG